MQTKSLNKKMVIWLFFVLPLLAMWIFRKSFNLGLYGDDWQHLYNLWRDFFVFHTKSFFDIRSYLNPYWPEYFYLGIINHFWGFYPPAYFIASFLCRLFANIALYFFSYELTKSKLAAFLSTIIFLVSAAGLQTTDWVFNMNTYAGLGLLAVSSTLYLRIRKLKTFKSWYYLFFILSFILALGIVPTRMHGAAPFIILTDLFLYIAIERKIRFDRYLLGRTILAAGIFFLLIQVKSFGESSYTHERFNDSYKLIQTLVQNGYSSWWLYFVGIIGHLILPDNISVHYQVSFLQNFFPIKNTLTGVLVAESIIFTIITAISSLSVIKSKKLLPILPILIFNIIWPGFLIIFSKIDYHTSVDIYSAIFLGGEFLFWAIWFYFISRNKYPEIASSLIISVFWIVCLTIIYWLFTPYFVIETTGRYMTMGGFGVAIFLGGLSSLLIKSAKNHATQSDSASKLMPSIYLGIPFVILITFMMINFINGQNYFNILYQTRNKDLTEKSWDKLVREVPRLDPAGPSVFYFTTDNPLSLEGVFVFGFFMRGGMTYRIADQDLTPLPVTNYKELLDFVKDGSPLQKVHGRKALPVPLSRVFAFDLRNGELTNITEIVRKKISEDLNLVQ